MKLPNGFRLIAGMSIFTFFVTNHTIPLYGAPLLNDSSSNVSPKPAPFAESFEVPKEMGEIQEIHKGNAEQIVFLIQDAHAVPDAQENISRLIGHIETHYGVNLVALEGASAALDPQIFQSFPDKEILREVFQKYAEKGELAGGPAAAIFSNQKAAYIGIEDWKLYEEGIRLYQKAAAHEVEISKRLEALKAKLDEQKSEIYSPGLLSLDRTLEEFYGNHASLLIVLKTLAGIQPPTPGTELALLLEMEEGQGGNARGLEGEILKRAERLGRLLKEKSSTPEGRFAFSQFNLKYQAFRTSQESSEAFGLFLERAAKKQGIRFPASSLFSQTVEQQKKLEAIRGTKLFKDFESYVARVKSGLIQTQAERVLDRQSERLRLLQDLARLELDFEKWNEVKRLFEIASAPLGMLPRNDCGSHCEEPPGGDEAISSSLLREFAPHLAFYEIALRRDQVFYKKLLQLMKSKKLDRAILIAGGFHTQGLTHLLKEKGISYVTLLPGIQSLPENSVYRSQMRGEISWKNYLKIENGKVNLYEAFVRATRDRLLNTGAGSNAVIARSPQEDSSAVIARSPEGATKQSTSTQIASATFGTLPRNDLIKPWRDRIIRDLHAQGRITESGEYTRFLDEISGETNPTGEMVQKAGEFVTGLRVLKASGRFTPENILKLVQPATTQTVSAVEPFVPEGRADARVVLLPVDVSALSPKFLPGLSFPGLTGESRDSRLPVRQAGFRGNDKTGDEFAKRGIRRTNVRPPSAEVRSKEKSFPLGRVVFISLIVLAGIIAAAVGITNERDNKLAVQRFLEYTQGQYTQGQKEMVVRWYKEQADRSQRKKFYNLLLRNLGYVFDRDGNRLGLSSAFTAEAKASLEMMEKIGHPEMLEDLSYFISERRTPELGPDAAKAIMAILTPPDPAQFPKSYEAHLENLKANLDISTLALIHASNFVDEEKAKALVQELMKAAQYGIEKHEVYSLILREPGSPESLKLQVSSDLNTYFQNYFSGRLPGAVEPKLSMFPDLFLARIKESEEVSNKAGEMIDLLTSRAETRIFDPYEFGGPMDYSPPYSSSGSSSGPSSRSGGKRGMGLVKAVLILLVAAALLVAGTFLSLKLFGNHLEVRQDVERFLEPNQKDREAILQAYNSHYQAYFIDKLLEKLKPGQDPKIIRRVLESLQDVKDPPLQMGALDPLTALVQKGEPQIKKEAAQSIADILNSHSLQEVKAYFPSAIPAFVAASELMEQDKAQLLQKLFEAASDPNEQVKVANFIFENSPSLALKEEAFLQIQRRTTLRTGLLTPEFTKLLAAAFEEPAMREEAGELLEKLRTDYQSMRGGLPELRPSRAESRGKQQSLRGAPRLGNVRGDEAISKTRLLRQHLVRHLAMTENARAEARGEAITHPQGSVTLEYYNAVKGAARDFSDALSSYRDNKERLSLGMPGWKKAWLLFGLLGLPAAAAVAAASFDHPLSIFLGRGLSALTAGLAVFIGELFLVRALKIKAIDKSGDKTISLVGAVEVQLGGARFVVYPGIERFQKTVLEDRRVPFTSRMGYFETEAREGMPIELVIEEHGWANSLFTVTLEVRSIERVNPSGFNSSIVQSWEDIPTELAVHFLMSRSSRFETPDDAEFRVAERVAKLHLYLESFRFLHDVFLERLISMGHAQPQLAVGQVRIVNFDHEWVWQILNEAYGVANKMVQELSHGYPYISPERKRLLEHRQSVLSRLNEAGSYLQSSQTRGISLSFVVFLSEVISALMDPAHPVPSSLHGGFTPPYIQHLHQQALQEQQQRRQQEQQAAYAASTQQQGQPFYGMPYSTGQPSQGGDYFEEEEAESDSEEERPGLIRSLIGGIFSVKGLGILMLLGIVGVYFYDAALLVAFLEWLLDWFWFLYERVQSWFAGPSEAEPVSLRAEMRDGELLSQTMGIWYPAGLFLSAAALIVSAYYFRKIRRELKKLAKEYPEDHKTLYREWFRNRLPLEDVLEVWNKEIRSVRTRNLKRLRLVMFVSLFALAAVYFLPNLLPEAVEVGEGEELPAEEAGPEPEARAESRQDEVPKKKRLTAAAALAKLQARLRELAKDNPNISITIGDPDLAEVTKLSSRRPASLRWLLGIAIILSFLALLGLIGVIIWGLTYVPSVLHQNFVNFIPRWSTLIPLSLSGVVLIYLFARVQKKIYMKLHHMPRKEFHEMMIKDHEEMLKGSAKMLIKLEGTIGGALLVLAISAVAGLIEEIFFRGLIQAFLSYPFGDTPYFGLGGEATLNPGALAAYQNLLALILTSYLFLKIHGKKQKGYARLQRFFVGTVFGGLYLLSNNLIPSILTHLLMDVLAGFGYISTKKESLKEKEKPVSETAPSPVESSGETPEEAGESRAEARKSDGQDFNRIIRRSLLLAAIIVVSVSLIQKFGFQNVAGIFGIALLFLALLFWIRNTKRAEQVRLAEKENDAGSGMRKIARIALGLLYITGIASLLQLTGVPLGWDGNFAVAFSIYVVLYVAGLLPAVNWPKNTRRSETRAESRQDLLNEEIGETRIAEGDISQPAIVPIKEIKSVLSLGPELRAEERFGGRLAVSPRRIKSAANQLGELFVDTVYAGEPPAQLVRVAYESEEVVDLQVFGEALVRAVRRHAQKHAAILSQAEQEYVNDIIGAMEFIMEKIPLRTKEGAPFVFSPRTGDRGESRSLAPVLGSAMKKASALVSILYYEGLLDGELQEALREAGISHLQPVRNLGSVPETGDPFISLIRDHAGRSGEVVSERFLVLGINDADYSGRANVEQYEKTFAIFLQAILGEAAGRVLNRGEIRYLNHLRRGAIPGEGAGVTLLKAQRIREIKEKLLSALPLPYRDVQGAFEGFSKGVIHINLGRISQILEAYRNAKEKMEVSA